MGVGTGSARAYQRQCCIAVPWVGLAVVSTLLVWQNLTGPQWSPASQVRRGDINATSGNQLHATQHHGDRTAGAMQPAVDAEDDIASSETWPVSKYLQCGDGWQSTYAAQHAAMLRGDLPPRYLVVQGVSGLADSLVGAVSMLYLALLQRRAFFMTFGGPQQYEWAFTAPHINWTWDPQLGAAHNTTELTLHSRKARAELQRILQHVASRDVQQLGADYVTLHVKSMAGFSLRLMDNPHHKGELWRLGVRPTTAFACGIDFLLRLRRQALEPHDAALKALTDNSALKIGIQIRTGDDVLVKGRGNDTDLAQYDAFFDCATQLEASRRASPEQQVLYYLISDSIRLRQLAAAALGRKLVTSLDVAVQHSRVQRKGRRPKAELERGFMSAAAEVWLFSLTDYQVITLHSGYGRLGAYMSGRFHQVYDIDFVQNQQTPPPRRSCSPYDYASMEYATPNSTGLGAMGL